MNLNYRVLMSELMFYYGDKYNKESNEIAKAIYNEVVQDIWITLQLEAKDIKDNKSILAFLENIGYDKIKNN